MPKHCLLLLLLTTAVIPYVASSDLPQTYVEISARVGQTVELPCLTNLSVGVDWWNLEGPTSTQRYVLASGYIQKAFRPRFNVASASDQGDYSLYVFDARPSDAGLYVCFQDQGLGRSHGYRLTVSDTPLHTTVGAVTSHTDGGRHPAEVALIVVVVILLILVTAAAAVAFWCCIRNRSRNKHVKKLEAGVENDDEQVPLKDMTSHEERPGSPSEEGRMVGIGEKMAETDTERGRIKSEMESAEEQQEKLRLELEQDSGEEERLTAELEQIKEKNRKLRDEVDAENKKVLKLEIKLEQLRKLSVQQLTQLEEQNRREAELGAELDKVKENETQLKRDLEKEKDLREKDKEDRRNRLTHEKQRLVAQLLEIEMAKKELMSRIKETDQKEKKLNEKHNRAQESENNLVQLMKREAARADQCKSKLRGYKRKVEQLRNELNSSAADVAHLKERIEKMEEQEAWMKSQLERDKLLQQTLKDANLREKKLEQHVDQLRRNTDELKQQLRETSKNKKKLQRQQQKKVKEEEEEESEVSSAELNEEAGTACGGKEREKSVVGKESKLVDQLEERLQKMAEKTDQNRKEFSRKVDEILHQMTSSVLQRSYSAQEVLHHTWQMVSDLEELCKRPEVKSMSRKEFQQKVVELVQETWVPRSNEYVQSGLQRVQKEMMSHYQTGFHELIQQVGAATEQDLQKSMELVDELKRTRGTKGKFDT